MTDEDTMTIRAMCEAFDVTPRTLRFYESKELLFPIRKGVQRLFTRADRARLKLILRGRRFGFSLEEIRQWLLIYGKQGERPQLEAWLHLADRQLAALMLQREEMDQSIADLATLRETAAEEIGKLPDL